MLTLTAALMLTAATGDFPGYAVAGVEEDHPAVVAALDAHHAETAAAQRSVPSEHQRNQEAGAEYLIRTGLNPADVLPVSEDDPVILDALDKRLRIERGEASVEDYADPAGVPVLCDSESCEVID
jgi:hypothetical protein